LRNELRRNLEPVERQGAQAPQGNPVGAEVLEKYTSASLAQFAKLATNATARGERLRVNVEIEAMASLAAAVTGNWARTTPREYGRRTSESPVTSAVSGKSSVT
jgi:hypothetical protein